MSKSFFTNKHIIVALLVTPILAVLAWYAVDAYVAEVPHKLKAGESYKMLAKPNCRWASGKCELVNNEVKISLLYEAQSTISLKSSVPLQDIKIALVDSPEDQSNPLTMTSQDGLSWSANLGAIYPNQFLQILVSIEKSVLFAVVPTKWIEKESPVSY